MVSMPSPSSEKVAVVTGAAGAIGFSITQGLVARGFHVFAADRVLFDTTRLDAGPGRVTPLVVDLITDEGPAAIAEAVSAAGGRLTLLVHNAGMILTAPVPEAAQRRQEQILNVQTPILLTERLFPALRAGSGSVIGIGSAGAFMPLWTSPGYSASKAGLRAYLLAVDAGRHEHGVRAAQVHPTAVDTPMLRREAEEGGSLANFVGRPQTPEAVAAAALSLLGRFRREVFVPRSAKYLLRGVAALPFLTDRLRPVLEYSGRRGLTRYLAALDTPSRAEHSA